MTHHRRVGDGRPALLAWGEAEIGADLKQLCAAMSAAGLKPPTAYAYPFGAYDRKTVAAMTAEGIAIGFTVEEGFVRQGDMPLTLRRQVIFPGTGLCDFARKLGETSPRC